jgi:D-alanine-D-alanine ligase
VTFSMNTPEPGLMVARASKRRGWFGGGGAQVSHEPLDVVFPLIHGTHGEDGTLQGALELANVPYVGSDVTASAIAINKVLTKRLLRQADIPVVDEYAFRRPQWQSAADQVVAEVEARFGYPVFVKPVHLGSSIGVSEVGDAAALRMAVDVALTYDSEVMIEPKQENIVEINCSVLADGETVRTSVCEQPVSDGALSYDQKYMQGGKAKGMKGSRRLIPAPIPDELTEAIQTAAQRTFETIGAFGVARVDVLARPDEGVFFVNEMNTLPGSLSFYLWRESGMSFPDLLELLIGGAQKRYADKQRNTYTFESSLLRTPNATGTKG